MANVIQRTEDIEVFFADLITEITNIPDELTLLRYAKDGQGSHLIDTDCAYISISEETDTRANFKNRSYVKDIHGNIQNVVQQASRTLVLTCVFYGPNSYELATLFNESLYLFEIKEKLDKMYLHIVSERTDGPIKTRELFNRQWYERTDLILRFYNTIQIESKAANFDSANIQTVFDF